MQDGRREHQVGQPQRVIGVQVRKEDDPQVGGAESRNGIAPSRRRRAPNDSRAGIHEIRPTAHDNGERRPASLGIGNRSARSEKNYSRRETVGRRR